MRPMTWHGVFCGLLIVGTMSAAPIPTLNRDNGKFQLVVDGQPYLILGAQVGNSNGWPALMERTWPVLKSLNCNTVAIPVYWEVVEPEQGRFDFSTVDALIDGARKNGFRLVLLWFASFKNGVMDYAPPWVKVDLNRYPRMLNPVGQPVRVLSPHYRASVEADARAFGAFMRHLRQADGDQRTVIMVQVENEPGSLETNRDHGKVANELFAGQVPQEVLAASKKRAGTWQQVFGRDADEFFNAYHIARYVNEVAAAGKKEYPLPLYANTWIEREADYVPGETHPSGGPTSRVLDIWKVSTPSIDILAPDIYRSNFQSFRAAATDYTRPDNPLYVPEMGASMDYARSMFYAIGEFNAIGVSPFGIGPIPVLAAAAKSAGAATPTMAELIAPVAVTYSVFAKAAPAILELQKKGQLRAAVEQAGVSQSRFEFDRYELVVQFGPIRSGYGGTFGTGNPDVSGRVLLGQLAPDEFLVAGVNGFIEFRPKMGSRERKAQFLSVEEGEYVNGQWRRAWLLNGDQTFNGLRAGSQGTLLRAKVMSY